MRASNLVASLSSVTVASALALPTIPFSIGSVTTASVPVVTPTNTAVPLSSEVTRLLSGLKAIDEAITTVTNNIGNFQPNNKLQDVVDIAKSFGSAGILNVAINDALLQTQSLNVKVSSEESKRITDIFRFQIAQHYQDVLQLLQAKTGDLKSASLQNSNLVNTLGGDNWLDVILSGLKLGLANKLGTALIKILDPAYQTVAYEAARIIQKALEGSIRVVV